MVVRLLIPGFNPGGGGTPPPEPPAYALADSAATAAGPLSGSLLPDGRVIDRAWSLAGSGAWVYTGGGIKPSAGATTLALFDAAGVEGSDGRSGRIQARITAKASTSPFIGLVARATDASNYLRFAIQASNGKYRLASYIPPTGANTIYETTAIDAADGDLVGLEVETVGGVGHIRMFVNGALIQDQIATNTLGNAALQGTKWGVIGSFTTDPTAALDDITWNPL